MRMMGMGGSLVDGRHVGKVFRYGCTPFTY